MTPSRLFHWSVVAWLAMPLAGQAEAGDWRAPKACGRNAAYVLAMSSAPSLTYRDVAAAIPVGERGTSLAQLADGLSSLGVPVRMVKGTPKDLASWDDVAIVHLDNERGLDETGHFVLLLDYDEAANRVVAIDGSTALDVVMTVDRFRRMWSGYAILPERSSWWLWRSLWVPIVTVSALVTFSWSNRRSRTTGVPRTQARGSIDPTPTAPSPASP